MTKNELKTATAVAFSQAAIEKLGKPMPQMLKACNHAFNLWPEPLTKKNYDTMTKWITLFEDKLWRGKLQEAHTNISFAMAIIEHQAAFLSDKKKNALDAILKVLEEQYEALEPPECTEYDCNRNADKARLIWNEVVNRY